MSDPVLDAKIAAYKADREREREAKAEVQRRREAVEHGRRYLERRRARRNRSRS